MESLVLSFSLQRPQLPIFLLCLSLLILLPINSSAGNQYVFPSDINTAEKRNLSERYYSRDFDSNNSEQSFFYSKPINRGHNVRKYRFPDGSEYEIKLGPTASESQRLESKNERKFSEHNNDSIERFKNKLKTSRFPNDEKERNNDKMWSNNKLLYRWPEEQIMKTITVSLPVERDSYYQQRYANTRNSTQPTYNDQGYTGVRNFSGSSSIYPFRNEMGSFKPLLRGLPETYPGYSTSEHILPFRTRFPGNNQHGFFNNPGVPPVGNLMDPYSFPRR